MAVESGKKQGLAFITRKAKEELAALTGLEPSTVLGAEKDGENWRVTVELIEKRSIPDSMDLLGHYEVHVDTDGQILNFTRLSLRKRGDTAE